MDEKLTVLVSSPKRIAELKGFARDVSKEYSEERLASIWQRYYECQAEKFEMTRKNKIMIGIMFAIGALICYASLRGVSYEELVHDLQTLKWSWAMVAVLSMALSVVFEALVVKILVQQHLPHYPMRMQSEFR